ncbi:hypothetical protein [Leptospira kanakyensis]|uniref:hypothetical protein n=1 Tax=Leptospira kanakyensis TaxID=2484968 RepID=UPI00223C9660|nr:hypothetical protein [Leptospira kanakyensis]MCW7468788.1 hypothetical protein [Leptospira kanakyensis]
MNQNIKKYKLSILAILFVLVSLLFINLYKKQNLPSEKKDISYSWNDPSLPFLGSGISEINNTTMDPQSFAVDIDQVIDDYKEWSEYPPNSRPLLDSHSDLLNPKQIEVGNQSLPVLENGKIIDSGYSCTFQPEKHTATEGQNIKIFLSCNKTGNANKEKLKLDTSEILRKAGSRTIRPPSIDGNDNGMNGDETSGDLVYTYFFQPNHTDWGDFFVTAKFKIQADPKQHLYSVTHHFFSSPVAPAFFTGRYDDYLNEGSLVIDVELNVKEPGRYTIEANLLTSNDEPIGYARNDKKLNSGKQTVSLLFFGKVIVKKRESGPYKLSFLRGELNTDVIQEELLTKSPGEVDRMLSSIHDDRPKKKVIPYYEGSIETKPYFLSDFSDKPYDSEEKRTRLSELQMLKTNRMP